MKKRSVAAQPWSFLLGLSLCFALAPVGKAEPITTTTQDWSLTVDPANGTMTIGYASLGMLLTNIELGVTGFDQGEVKGWTIDQRATGRWVVRSAEPLSTWVFEPARSALRISSTSPNAVLRARMPVSDGRVIARLLDPEGFPVEWAGTGEVAGGYGGSWTRNRSFLPRHNPECMYFALGPVYWGPFHCLFDRATDTAIELPQQARFHSGSRPGLAELVMPVAGSVEIRLKPDYFTKTLGVPFYAPFREDVFPTPPAVWCSWTSYYGDVTEEAVVTNTDWLARNLEPYGFRYVQVDDGYDRGAAAGHYWIENWDKQKFPHGPQWLAAYIKSRGLHPGLWLVPNAYAGAVQNHPEWYLRDRHGTIILDYGTPALDSSNPEVLDFLKTLFTRLRGWGFDYFKFDGEHALPQYVPAVDRTRLYDKKTDPITVYRKRLELIRGVIGPDTFVEGCPAGTPLNGVGFFNSYFNGQDAYNNWNGMHSLFSSINGNAFLNRMVVYVMPGEGMELGPRLDPDQARKQRVAEVMETARTREQPITGLGVTSAEARTLVSLVALTGVVYPLAGVMPELPAERLELLQRTLPTMPVRPVDLFSRGTDLDWDTFKHVTADDYIQHYPEVLDLKVNSTAGSYDVIALPNWRSAPVSKTVSFSEKLGLDPGASYVAFDFWNQKLLGLFRDSLSTEVGGHDTRVIQLHPLVDHPQLIGISRHISGSYSVSGLAWDASALCLRGSAETIPGQPYTLFAYVPAAFGFTGGQAWNRAGEPVTIQCREVNSLLSATLPGVAGQVAWQISFKPVKSP